MWYIHVYIIMYMYMYVQLWFCGNPLTKMQGQHYALPQVESTFKGGAPDDLHQVVYAKVKPHSIAEQIEDQNIDCTSDRAGIEPDIENLF